MKTLTKEQESKLESISTVSGKIRFLDSLNFTRLEIAKKLDKRYQHVRNVLITPIKSTSK